MSTTKQSSAVITLALVAGIAIVVAIVLWMNYSSLQQANAALQTQVNGFLAVQKQADDKAAAELEQRIALFKLNWPAGGDRLCYENQYYVSWQVPSDMDIVHAVISSPSGNYDLGDHPANGGGTNGDVANGGFSWDLTYGSGSSMVVPPSDVYKIQISGMYQGHQIQAESPRVFSVAKCQ